MESVATDTLGHIPRERIMDIDVYALPGAERDFLSAWKTVQEVAPFSLIWTPRNGGHWIATRGREIAAAYTDHAAFSSRVVLVPRKWAEAFQVKPTTLDPPVHAAYRHLISAALTPQTVEALRPAIREAACDAVEAVRSRGRCEFIAEVASEIPLPVFMHMAGLPREDIARLPRYNEALIDEAGKPTGADVMTRFAAYLRPHCEERLTAPGTDFLSRLIRGKIDGRPMALEDAVDMATTMMTGGIDTVIAMLGHIMAHLSRDALTRRRLVEEPERIPAAVRELLRRYPIMTKARLVTRATTLDGVTLRPGEMIVLPPLHGLDDRVFDDPLVVDIDRPAQPNLTFGTGVHRCPGTLLALVEIETTLAVWLDRIPDFGIDPQRPARTQAGVLGAMKELGLVWAGR